MSRNDSGPKGQKDNYRKGFCGRCGEEFSAQGRGLGNLCEECEADLMDAELDDELDDSELDDELEDDEENDEEDDEEDDEEGDDDWDDDE